MKDDQKNVNKGYVRFLRYCIKKRYFIMSLKVILKLLSQNFLTSRKQKTKTNR